VAELLVEKQKNKKSCPQFTTTHLLKKSEYSNRTATHSNKTVFVLASAGWGGNR